MMYSNGTRTNVGSAGRRLSLMPTILPIGYVAENGIALCPDCHKNAEVFHATGTTHPGFSPEDLYRLIGSSKSQAEVASRQLKSKLATKPLKSKALSLGPH
jgi:hypothetical protein